MITGVAKASPMWPSNPHGEREDGPPEPMQEVAYTCGHCHRVKTLTMHAKAKPPATWVCVCGEVASLDGERIETHHGRISNNGSVQKTHMQLLRERRTEAELEALLEERLAMLRAGEIGPL